jgi:hypothetical protein
MRSERLKSKRSNKMIEKTLNTESAEEFALYVASISAKVAMDVWMWRIFGYKRIPKRGSFFNKFIDQTKLIQENFILRELFICNVATAVISLPYTCSNELKSKIASRAIDIIFSQDGMLESFNFNSIHEALLYFGSNISDYLSTEYENYSDAFIKHANNVVGDSLNSSWTIGAKLFLFSNSGSLVKRYSITIQDDFTQPLDDDINFINKHVMEYIKV